MKIDNSKLYNEIIQKLNIVEIVSEYIEVVKSGKNFFAICPFHNDTNPSLSISNDKKIFKCFTCNVSGNIITFVKEFNNFTFAKTMEILAKKVGYDFHQDNHHKSKHYLEKEKIWKINSDAFKLFQLNLMLKNNKKIINYLLNNRKLQLENIHKFKIGYADNKNSDLIYKRLLSLGYKISDLEKAGLISTNNNSVSDFFKERIIISILDEEGNIIGFAGRTINKNPIKYLNTKTNLLFSKGKILYNIYNAKLETRRKQYIILVEGYLDIISLFNKGIFNVVSTMGTALTNDHISSLKKITKKVVLFFDGDDAGVNANLTNAFFLLKNDFDTKIIVNDTKYDPDELCHLDNGKRLEEIMSNESDPIEYLISKTNFDKIDDINNLLKYKKELEKSKNTNPLKLSVYIKKLNDILMKKGSLKYFNENIEKEKNEERIKLKQNIKLIPVTEYNDTFIKVSDEFNETDYQSLFIQMLTSRKALRELKNNIAKIDIINDIYRCLIAEIFDFYAINKIKDDIKYNDMIDHLKNKNLDKNKYIFILDKCYSLILQNIEVYNEIFLKKLINKFIKDSLNSRVIKIANDKTISKYSRQSGIDNIKNKKE